MSDPHGARHCAETGEELDSAQYRRRSLEREMLQIRFDLFRSYFDVSTTLTPDSHRYNPLEEHSLLYSLSFTSQSDPACKQPRPPTTRLSRFFFASLVPLLHLNELLRGRFPSRTEQPSHKFQSLPMDIGTAQIAMFPTLFEIGESAVVRKYLSRQLVSSTVLCLSTIASTDHFMCVVTGACSTSCCRSLCDIERNNSTSFEGHADLFSQIFTSSEDVWELPYQYVCSGPSDASNLPHFSTDVRSSKHSGYSPTLGMVKALDGSFPVYLGSFCLLIG